MEAGERLQQRARLDNRMSPAHGWEVACAVLRQIATNPSRDTGCTERDAAIEWLLRKRWLEVRRPCTRGFLRRCHAQLSNGPIGLNLVS